jgi:hypothetical protein
MINNQITKNISIKERFFTKEKLLFGSIVFVLVFILCGVLYKNMGHDSDAFGMVYGAAKERFTFASFFKVKSSADTESTLNEMHNKGWGDVNFFSTYRPLRKLMIYFSFKLFGENAYAYFLVAAFFHAFTSVLLFLIFTFFLSNLYAFLLSIVFAFHPVLFNSYIGLTCLAIPVFLFLFLSAFLYALYYRFNYLFLYFLSAVIYFVSLFFYEMPLSFPFIILLFLLFFDKKNIFKKSYLFFLAMASYFFTKILLFGGMAKNQNVTILSVVKLIKCRIISTLNNWYQMIKPFWGMQDFSKVFVSVITGIFLIGVVLQLILDKKNRKKIVFYILSFFAASWVLFIYCSNGRYLYFAVPFFCLIVFEQIKFLSGFLSVKFRKGFVVCGLLLFSVWGIYRATSSLKRRELYTYRRDIAFQNIVKKYGSIKDLQLVYLGALQSYNNESFLLMSCMAQASSLFFKNFNLPVYQTIELRFYVKKTTDKNFNIYPIPGGYRFVSTDPENIFVMCPYSWVEGKDVDSSMGVIKVNKKLDGWQATDVSFVFNDRWLELFKSKNTIFLTWDVAKWEFVELEHKNLFKN